VSVLQDSPRQKKIGELLDVSVGLGRRTAARAIEGCACLGYYAIARMVVTLTGASIIAR